MQGPARRPLPTLRIDPAVVQAAKETQAAFVREGVNILVDMISLGVLAKSSHNPPPAVQ